MTYTTYSGRPLEGSYSVKLYTPEGVPLNNIGEVTPMGESNVITTFNSLHYVKAVNGMFAHGWGEFSIVIPKALFTPHALDLDTVVHIFRKPPTSTWDIDFYGIHRKSEVKTDGDALTYTTSGFDLKSLLKRRVILPDDGSVPYTEGWYTLVNNVGAVWGIIPKEFTTEPTFRMRQYESECYPEAFDGNFHNVSENIMIAGAREGINETQRYLYIGCTGKFSKIRFTFGTVNASSAATLWVQYYASVGWITLEGATDNTDVGGKPFAQDGTYEFTVPEWWAKGTGVTFSGFGDVYWLRFTLVESGDTTQVNFTLKEVEVYGTPEVDTLRWCSGTDHWTDIMRHLVRDQCISGSITMPVFDGVAWSRVIAGLSCEDDTHEGLTEEGDQLNLCYRYDNLATVLEEISGLGADWDVVETAPGHYQFRVDYQQNHWSANRTEGNTDGNTPVTFSLENGNIEGPVYMDDRTSEVTVCYGTGKLTNGVRPVYRRTSPYSAELASVWNYIEATSDGTSQDNQAAVVATADGFLADNTQKIEVSFQAKQTPNCLYGVHWNLGDLVGFYFNKFYYEMRIVAVDVTVDDNGEAIVPTLVRLPSLDTEYWA